MFACTVFRENENALSCLPDTGYNVSLAWLGRVEEDVGYVNRAAGSCRRFCAFFPSVPGTATERSCAACCSCRSGILVCAVRHNVCANGAPACWRFWRRA
ncbi:hypothetical protein TENDC279_0926a [Treponema pallidum subsp. endemicum]|nr:hypothetical protein TENDC77_0926a [Treponema pallidum subsp. endemicum]UPN53040.1 hypothetical protein TENDC279_0926a [Treponema pallidum subsp. endemicum]